MFAKIANEFLNVLDPFQFGVAISGGRGNLWGVFVGLLLLTCVNPALTYLHVEAYWEKAIQGAIILLAVVADGIRTRQLRN